MELSPWLLSSSASGAASPGAREAEHSLLEQGHHRHLPPHQHCLARDREGIRVAAISPPPHLIGFSWSARYQVGRGSERQQHVLGITSSCSISPGNQANCGQQSSPAARRKLHVGIPLSQHRAHDGPGPRPSCHRCHQHWRHRPSPSRVGIAGGGD